MALFKFAAALFEGRPIDIYNHGKMSRDFTFIDDLIEALVRLIGHAPPLAGGREPRQSLSRRALAGCQHRQ
jgi:UDP-glucuronate 4-epimerase